MANWDKSGKAPKYISRAERRNTVRTDRGYVRRVKKGTRVQDEILVTIGDFGTPTSPDVTDIYFASTTVVAGANSSVFVAFDEPLQFGANSGDVKLTVANTTGGAVITAVAVANNAQLKNADNTLEFKFTTVTAGSYAVRGQTLANNSANAVALKSLNTGNTNANLSFTNADSIGVLTVV